MPSPPLGVPVHDLATLAEAAGLLTGPVMDRRRLRPKKGAKMAGTYWTGHAWAPLWRTRDVVPKAALSPGRQAIWDGNRTCARCGKRSADPWTRQRNGRRYCDNCIDPGMRAWWYEQRTAERPALQEWAAAAVAAADVVLVAAKQQQLYVEMHAETVAGEILLETRIRYPRGRGVLDLDGLPADVVQSTIGTAEAIGLLEALRGRRLLSWQWWTTPADAALNLMATGPGELGLHETRHLQVASGEDLVGPKYDRWVGEPEGSPVWASRCKSVPAPVHVPAALVARLRTALQEMATATLPLKPEQEQETPAAAAAAG